MSFVQWHHMECHWISSLFQRSCSLQDTAHISSGTFTQSPVVPHLTFIPSALRSLKKTDWNTQYIFVSVIVFVYVITISKWHLGFFDPDYLPNARGFDTFMGYYGDKEEYYMKVCTYTLPLQPQY